MKIYLLTHERELHRATNTGAIALQYASNIVERLLWQRLSPPAALTRLIENNEAVLLYSNRQSDLDELTPANSTEPLKKVTVNINNYQNIIIIDSTWQEAQKIFNQSPYLKKTPQFTLKAQNNSLYKLRANQPEGGLCTIECIIEVLRLKQQDKIANDLALRFALFNG